MKLRMYRGTPPHVWQVWRDPERLGLGQELQDILVRVECLTQSDLLTMRIKSRPLLVRTEIWVFLNYQFRNCALLFQQELAYRRELRAVKAKDVPNVLVDKPVVDPAWRRLPCRNEWVSWQDEPYHAHLPLAVR